MVSSVHAKVAIGWICCVAGGIGAFYFVKRSVDKDRYENMKVRQRMQTANDGSYQPSYRKFSRTSEN